MSSLTSHQDSPRISVLLLTYNEECNVRHALESVRWCDDVVVVDSFSTDRTEEICRTYPNVKFVQHAFRDLASQRQYALDEGLLKHEWVLALDADEVVPPVLRDELREIVARYRPGEPVAYDIAMRIVFWGRWLRFSSEYPIYWRRFFRPDAARYVQRGHADTLDVEGPVGRTRHDLIHEDRKGLSDWIDKHNRYSTQEALYALDELIHTPLTCLFARDRLLRRRAIKRIFRALPLNSLIRFLYLYLARGGFLDGAPGFDFCRLRAQQNFLIQLKMKELRRLRAARKVSESPSLDVARETQANAATDS